MVPDISPILYVATIIVTVLLSITLHEAMHAFAANWLGDDTARLEGRLTLNPLKHIDPFLTVAMPVLLALAGAPPLGAAKPVPFNPNRLKYDEFGAAIVGVAGPLTNFMLAIVSGLTIRFIGDFLGSGVVEILSIFTIVNLAFFVFNMIPFPPLDGSRVLYAFAPETLQRVMRQIESFGLVGFLLFFFLLFQFVSPLISRAIFTILKFIVGI